MAPGGDSVDRVHIDAQVHEHQHEQVMAEALEVLQTERPSPPVKADASKRNKAAKPDGGLYQHLDVKAWRVGGRGTLAVGDQRSTGAFKVPDTFSWPADGAPVAAGESGRVEAEQGREAGRWSVPAPGRQGVAGWGPGDSSGR